MNSDPMLQRFQCTHFPVASIAFGDRACMRRRHIGTRAWRAPGGATLADLAATENRPDRLDATVACRVDFLVQMHRGVGIADDPLQPVAHAGRFAWAVKFDDAVLC